MRFEQPLALLLTLSAAACATPQMVKQDTPVPTVADLHKINVTQSGERLELPLGGSNGALSSEAAAQLDQFGAAYRATGHGPLMLSTPAGSGDADSAARLAQAARMQLVTNGVPFAAIAGSSYDASGKATAPVVLSYMRYTAEAPACAPVWSVNLADTTSNRPYGTFGCSLNANLAAMLSDPADLEGPRPIEPRDAARRDVVLDKYRNGESPGATRTNDERATISQAIQ
jgi:pilus assembly protein CpaD